MVQIQLIATDGFVLNSSLVFSGSGELDNGMTVSVFQNLFAGSVTSEGLSLDMGDMGVLHMNSWGYTSGITSIADKVPTAGENVMMILILVTMTIQQ